MAWLGVRFAGVTLMNLRLADLDRRGILDTGSSGFLYLALAWFTEGLSFGAAGYIIARLVFRGKLNHAAVLGSFLLVFNVANSAISAISELAIVSAVAIVTLMWGAWLGRFLTPPNEWQMYGQALSYRLANGSTVEVRSARRSLLAAATLYALTCAQLVFALVVGLIVPDSGNYVFFGFLPGAIAMFSFARRADQPSIERPLLGTEPLIVYLRSFVDDDGPRQRRRGVIFKRSVEQELCKVLSHLGPVVAIGQPGEVLPPLGAARLYVQDAHWQALVSDLVSRSSLIVLRVGSSPGLQWELADCVARIPPRRLVLFVQGDTAQKKESVWSQFRGWANLLLPFPLPKEIGDSWLVCFGDDWSPCLITRQVARRHRHDGTLLADDHCLRPLLARISARKWLFSEDVSARKPARRFGPAAGCLALFILFSLIGIFCLLDPLLSTFGMALLVACGLTVGLYWALVRRKRRSLSRS
jgi:hypothetical protein